MSRLLTYEQQKLQEAEKFIVSIASSHDERLTLLEYVAAMDSKLDIQAYWNYFCYKKMESIEKPGKILYTLLKKCGVPIPYAISSLARAPVSIYEQKKNGAFYSDYRLAEALRFDCIPYIKKNVRVADFAAGTGILLVGIVQEYKKKYKNNFDEWISNNLYVYDLSDLALRGAAASMIPIVKDIATIVRMRKRWKACDSLFDSEIDYQKYDIIVGNPPWGKIKISRHSYSKLNGADRVYGEEYDEFDDKNYKTEKGIIHNYSKKIKDKYSLLGEAEPDTYMAFIQRALLSLKPGGHMSLLVPAGLIRSQGTKELREYLIAQGKKLEYYLFDNKGRFFSIDSRFKFLIVSFDRKNSKSNLKSFSFRRCGIEEESFDFGEKIDFDVKKLSEIRRDLTVPEISTVKEKELYFKIYNNADCFSYKSGVWKAEICREVDMTNNRNDFQKNHKDGNIPVIEGRMVQQYRFGAKSYVSGSGRSAVWKICAGSGKSQFYYSVAKLNDKQQSRISVKRVGFCDIAGQTNERAMMCAIIPENVVCGNKVPTITFPDDLSGDRIYLWTGIANSFVFDWLIRRIISTTINYFLLLSVPLPRIDITSKEAKSIIRDVKKISEMGDEYYGNNEMERLRSNIEVNVATAYGLNLEDLETVMDDFPIIDRHQPALDGECKSSISKDAVLGAFEKKVKTKTKKYSIRYQEEKEKGAYAFIPSEMAVLVKEKK